MANRLSGKTAICTASGQGIGRAVAIAFAREGAHVVATDVDPAKLEGLREEGVAETHRLDVLSLEAITGLAASVPAPDVLFNCAGIVHYGTILDCSEEDWSLSFDVNVRGIHRVIRTFLPAMIARGGGSIVNVASVVSSIKAAPNRYVYASTKAAIIGLTKALAIDFIDKGIRCNCICPGTIQSPSLEERIAALGPSVGGAEKAREMFVARQPMGRLGTTAEVAALAVYLASDESSFTTGAVEVIDGGFSL